MSFETQIEQNERLDKYTAAKAERARIELQVIAWMQKMTDLYTNDKSTAAEKADALAQRDAFVAALQVTLGV